MNLVREVYKEEEVEDEEMDDVSVKIAEEGTLGRFFKIAKIFG